MNNYSSYKNIWKIAYPIILGSLAQDIITVVDTAFIGHLGTIELGGAAIGGIFYLALVMIGLGFGLGVQILIARRYGENNTEAINKIFHHSFIILVILSLVTFSIIKTFHLHIFESLIQSKAVTNESIKFINIRIFGIFAAFLNINFRAFYIGIAYTRIISYTTLFMAVINIGLDYMLIFGNGIFPKMNIEGAALASVIAEYCALFIFILYTKYNTKIVKFNLPKLQNLSIPLIKNILKISTPSMIQNFISFSAWFVFFLFVEKMGETPLAISNIIRSIYIIVLVPIFGFASATNTLVSYSIGKKNFSKIKNIIKRSLFMAMCGIAIFVIVGISFPRSIISIYTQNSSIINATIPVFYVIMLASFALAFGFIILQAVSGTGNTFSALKIELLVLSLYLFGVYLLSNKNAPSIELVWSLEFFYGLGLGLFSLAYMKFGKWNKKVI